MPEGQIVGFSFEGDSYRLEVRTANAKKRFFWPGDSCNKQFHEALLKKGGPKNIKIKYKVLGPLVQPSGSPLRGQQVIKLLSVEGKC